VVLVFQVVVVAAVPPPADDGEGGIERVELGDLDILVILVIIMRVRA